MARSGATSRMIVALACLAAALPPAAAAASAAPILHIAGNHFVAANGRPMRIFAVHFGTSEYDCVQPLYGPERRGVFSIPTSDAAIQAITTWHANTMRISLNDNAGSVSTRSCATVLRTTGSHR